MHADLAEADLLDGECIGIVIDKSRQGRAPRAYRRASIESFGRFRIRGRGTRRYKSYIIAHLSRSIPISISNHRHNFHASIVFNYPRSL